MGAARGQEAAPGTGEVVQGMAKAGDGVRVAYQVAGGGPALILLAGQANSHHWWDGVREDFEATRTTITIDYRGTGDSDKPRDAYSTEIFAGDVVAVLDDLGVDRADVYGTSMGGRVAQWLAARHADRVDALVLGCTSPGGAHGFERGADVRKALGQLDQRAARRALLELMYTPGWLANHPGPYQTLGDPRMPPFARKGHLLASDRHDAWAVLPDITARTLVLHGGNDRFNPTANAELVAGRIPGAVAHIIPGTRHAYFEEFRAVAGPLVVEFLG